MIKNSNNIFHRQANSCPTTRLLYNGMELIPFVRALDDTPTHSWHVPGGEIMTTGALIDLAKLRNVVIKIIDYNKRPLQSGD